MPVSATHRNIVRDVGTAGRIDYRPNSLQRRKLMKKVLLGIAVLAIVAAPVVGFACDSDKKIEATVASAGSAPCAASETAGSGCCAKNAKAAALAANAEAGCQKSQAAMLAMAKDSGCAKTSALAAKAEAGDEEAVKTLVAMYKAEPAMAKTDSQYTNAQLAEWAGAGCEKSTAALIAEAKASGCAKTSALAEAAEGGCQKSKEALIAKYSETEDSEATLK